MAGRHAVVIGGGVGGLATAGGLAAAGWDVTVVERDTIPGGWVQRPGVPQSSQLHNLLGRAQREISALVPDFLPALRESGAAFADVSTDTAVVEYGISMPRRPLAMELVCAPQPQAEGVLRDVVLRDPRVRLLAGTIASDVDVRDERAVAVVTSTGRLDADIVVDCSGKGSRVLDLVAASGFGEVRTESIPVRQWYVSATVRRPDGALDDPTFWLTFPDVGGTRGGLVSPLGRDRWVVSLSGTTVDRPPTDLPSMVAYAATLDDPAIADLLRTVTIEVPPRLFRKPDSRWRHVEELEDRVAGLLFVGDAVGSLNPLLGQGISSAFWQARLLVDLVTEVGTDDLAALTVAQRQSTTMTVSAALALTRLDQIELPDGAGGSVSGVDRMRTLSSDAEADEALHRAIVRMWHLLEDVDPILGWPSTAPGTTAAAAAGGNEG